MWKSVKRWCWSISGFYRAIYRSNSCYSKQRYICDFAIFMKNLEINIHFALCSLQLTFKLYTSQEICIDCEVIYIDCEVTYITLRYVTWVWSVYSSAKPKYRPPSSFDRFSQNSFLTVYARPFWKDEKMLQCLFIVLQVGIMVTNHWHLYYFHLVQWDLINVARGN